MPRSDDLRTNGARPPARPRTVTPSAAPEPVAAAPAMTRNVRASSPAPAPVPTGAPTQIEGPVPFDRAANPDGPALDLLSADLAAAGRRARGRKSQVLAARPEVVFTTTLRNRLAPPVPLDLVPEGLPPTPVAMRLVVRPTTRRRTPALRPLLLIGLCVALIAVGGFAISSGFLGPVAANRAGQAVDATLVRAGGSQALVAGTALAAGDEVRVASAGSATLILGSSQARLAGGADVKITTLSSSTVQLALLAGRAYNRVVLPAGGSYAVVTGPYTWTASGTAFDVTRGPDPVGGEQVTLLALEHSIAASGPATNRQIPEGSSVSVVFGSPSSDEIVVGSIPQSVFGDPWLIGNAKTDESLGYPIGALAAVALAPNGTPTVSPTATDQPTSAPTDSPLASPSPSDGPSPSSAPTGTPTPTAHPTATPTATPTASPSPSPSPTGTPQPTLGLSPNSCTGGTILSWSKYGGIGFVKYVLLRSSVPAIPKAYPAQGGASVIASTTVRTSLTASDASGVDGLTYFYRTLVLGSGNAILEASNVVTAPAFGVGDFNPVSVNQGYVVWNGFGGSAACFSEYRVEYSPDSDFGSQVRTIIVTSQKSTNVQVPAAGGIFSPGDTIYFRVQVVHLGIPTLFVVAQTSGTPPSFTY
jgi:hypothetical protein